MMKKSARQQSPPQKGSDRVSAWIHTVINPLIEALRIEKNFLEERNWTWRYPITELEFIRPLQLYLDYAMRPNFEDFLRANSKFRKDVERQDDLLRKLTEECRKAFKSLEGNRPLQERLGELRSDYMRGGKESPGGTVPEEEFFRLIAQYLVNNIKELPPYYTTSEFWNRFGEELLRFRTGEAFQRLEKAGEDLRDHDERLIKKLEDLRFEFCEKYDIPAAPFYVSQAG